MIETWVEEEYATLDLLDARLSRRATCFVSQAAGIGNSNTLTAVKQLVT